MRFKSTNVYLNRITVKPRLEDNLDTVFVAKDAIADEEIFMKERSVFKDFREDSEEFLWKCFIQDVEYSKLARLFKKDKTVFEKVKEKLFEHYLQLINIFDFYSGISEYPRISMMDMTSFAHHTNILDQ